MTTGDTWAVELPERYIACTFENFDPAVSPAAAAALSAARRFVEEQHSSLVLVGRPGAGKSHLAAAICDAEWARTRDSYLAKKARIQELPRDEQMWPAFPSTPLWVNVPDLISRLRGGDPEVRAEARAAGAHHGLVVLDDLGREKASEWTGEAVYVLVNTRYEALARTVVTSNLTIAELEANGYGPAISRLAEDGLLVEMASATDYRTRRTS